MITDHLHPLDDVTLFGHCIHGLVSGSINEAFVEVDGVQFPIPPTPTYRHGTGTLQIVRHPAAGPVALSPEVLAAERAQGRVWQNFALVKGFFGTGVIYGQQVDGWIFIDSLGQRWLAQITSQPLAVVGSPYSLTVSMKPFGYLDGAPDGMEPVDLTLTCADILQEGSATRRLLPGMANSLGTQRLLQMVPTSPANALPSGYLQINLTDVEGVPSGTLTVLRSQAQMRGDWDTNATGITGASQLFTAHNLLVAAEISPPIDRFPPGGGSATVTVTGIDEVSDNLSPLDQYRKGSPSLSCGRTGRILCLAFDDSDELVPITFDTRYVYDASYPDWAGSASGTLTSSGDDQNLNYQAWTVAVAPAVTASRTVSEAVESTIIIRRAGVEVCRVENRRSFSATLTATLAAYSGAWGWAGGWIGRWSEPNALVFAERVNTTASSAATDAADEKGGPWPATTPAEPSVIGGSTFGALLGSFPLGTEQRDADVLQFSFTVSYRLNPGYEDTIFQEVTGGGPSAVVRELAIVYPHAELLAREFDQRPVAYDPIGHVATIAPENGGLFSYV